MAEVTGFFGDQPVELNNAATEATLKQLVQAMSILSAKVGGAKSPKEIEAEMKKFQKAMEKANKNTEKQSKLIEEGNKLKAEENKATKDAIAAKDKEADQAEYRSKKIGQGFQNLEAGIKGATSSFMGLLSELSNMGNDLNSVSGIMKKVPIIGGLLGDTFGAVAGAATKTYKAFNTAASVGANFGGSIGEMQRSVAGTGLTLDQYTSLIKNNSDAIAMFGGGITNGTKRFTVLSKQLVGSGLGDELARLGYTTEDINGSLLKYGAMQAKASGGRAMSDQELVKSTGQYLKDLDAVAKLTGKSKESMEKEQEARQADAQFRILQAKIGKEGTDNLNMLMNSMSKSEQQAAQSILATGTLNNEAAQQLMITNPQAAKALLQASKDIKQSGTITREGAFKIDDAFNAGAIASKKNAAQMVLGTFESEKYSDGIVSNLNRATKAETENASLRKAAAQTEVDAANKLADGLKPEVMKNNMEKLATMSNKFMEVLANSPILGQMLDAFGNALTTVTPILLNTFNFIAEHGKTLLIVFGGIAAASMGLSLAMKLHRLAVIASEMGMTKFGGFLGGAAKGVLRFLGPIGLLVTAALLLYENFDAISNGFMDILDSIRSYLPAWMGGISKEEAEVRKRKRAEAQASKEVTDAKQKESKYQETFAPDLALGKVAAQFESGGNAGAVSSGHGDAGGKSYGSFQLSSKTGDVDKFLKKSGYDKQFQGMQVGSAQFDEQWKKLAKEDSKFGEAQANHAKSTHYDPQVAKLKENGLDLSKKGIGVQEAIMSTANQYGANSSVITNALKGKDTGKMSDKDIIDAIQDYKAASVKTNFKSSSAAVQEGVAKRIEQERMALYKAGATAGANGVATASPTTPTTGATPPASSTQTALTKPAATPTNANMPANPLDALKQGMNKSNQASLGGSTPAGPASQENPTTLLSSLNMKMDQLIRIQSGAKETGEKQLKKTASGGANMDMFTNVSIV